MDSRCEVLIEKIYGQLKEVLKSYDIVLEDLDDYFYEYEKEELEDILEDIRLNYLNRRYKWEKRIVEETLGEGTYENNPEGSEGDAGQKQSVEVLFTDSKYDEDGYDTEGCDILGWSREGYHKTTGTRYNRDGYDREGYTELNWSKKGIHKTTGTEYNEAGYDIAGYDTSGWSIEGVNKRTQTMFDEAGYNKKGYDIQGWNKQGYNEKTGTLYDEGGFDREGNKETILQKIKSIFK